MGQGYSSVTEHIQAWVQSLLGRGERFQFFINCPMHVVTASNKLKQQARHKTYHWDKQLHPGQPLGDHEGNLQTGGYHGKKAQAATTKHLRIKKMSHRKCDQTEVANTNTWEQIQIEGILTILQGQPFLEGLLRNLGLVGIWNINCVPVLFLYVIQRSSCLMSPENDLVRSTMAIVPYGNSTPEPRYEFLIFIFIERLIPGLCRVCVR